MAIVVRPFVALSSASCTIFSEFESNAEVASSKRITLGLRRRARAMAIRSVGFKPSVSDVRDMVCHSRFCPPNNCDPLPPT